ncbi:phage tail tube protein [Lentzea chajnantorensis]
MGKDKSVTLVPGKGEYWLAPIGTAYPADPDDPGSSGYTEVGYTSRESPMQVAREGGESTVLGAWQDEAMRDDVSAVRLKVAFSLLQYDIASMKLYHGSNAAVASGRLKPPKKPVPTEAVLFIRIVDGPRAQYRYYDRVSIIGADSEEFDVAQLASMPVAATILGADGSDYLGELSVPAPMGANELQQIAITGGPTGGTWTATLNGQTTSGIPYNAAATAVRTALEALSTIGAGNVTCTGGPLPGTAVVVEFVGTLAGVDVPQMTTSSASLTGGTSPTVAVTTTTPGGS